MKFLKLCIVLLFGTTIFFGCKQDASSPDTPLTEKDVQQIIQDERFAIVYDPGNPYSYKSRIVKSANFWLDTDLDTDDITMASLDTLQQQIDVLRDKFESKLKQKLILTQERITKMEESGVKSSPAMVKQLDQAINEEVGLSAKFIEKHNKHVAKMKLSRTTWRAAKDGLLVDYPNMLTQSGFLEACKEQYKALKKED